MSRDRAAAMFARIGAYSHEIPVILAWLRRCVFGAAADRPGVHYMPGPGPKWREKSRERCDD